MNIIEQLVASNKQWLSSNGNNSGNVFADGAPQLSAAYDNSRQSIPSTYNRSTSNQATLNDRNAAIAAKWKAREDQEVLTNVAESSEARGRSAVVSELENLRVQKRLADIEAYAPNVTPSDVAIQATADQNARAQGLPLSNSIHAEATRGVAQEQNTVQQNSDILGSVEVPVTAGSSPEATPSGVFDPFGVQEQNTQFLSRDELLKAIN